MRGQAGGAGSCRVCRKLLSELPVCREGGSSRPAAGKEGSKLPFQCFFSIGRPLQPVDDVIEVGHFLVTSLSVPVGFGALEGGQQVSIQAVIGARRRRVGQRGRYGS